MRPETFTPIKLGKIPDFSTAINKPNFNVFSDYIFNEEELRAPKVGFNLKTDRSPSKKLQSRQINRILDFENSDKNGLLNEFPFNL